ncbi:DUF2304 domain-containing protein [Paenibacillus sp. GCM10028914]|uniref:DUF2304 domain-containing protein n=1 Tax=Paenibacillus sp. GCM10028914 TaxID=3273416 RepID=UPI003618C158
MKLNVYFVSFCISLVFAATILYLIRKRKLKEQYALLWLLMSTIMMVLSLFPSLLDELAVRIDIFYAPSLLYLLSVVAVLFILLHLTIAVSSLSQKVVVLTQTLGLQEDRIQKLERQLAEQQTETPECPGTENNGFLQTIDPSHEHIDVHADPVASDHTSVPSYDPIPEGMR